MKNRLIIVGASGFLGQRYLTESQILRNNFFIICCTSSYNGKSKIDTNFCDLILTIDELFIELSDAKYQYIILNMAYSSYGTPWRRILDTKNLLTKLCTIPQNNTNCIGFIEISSQSVFGYKLKEGISPWTKLPSVDNDYCKSKQYAEKIVLKSFTNLKIPFAIIRVGNIIGKGSLPWIERPLKYFHTCNFEMLSDLSGSSNVIYVRNLIDYLNFLINNGVPNSINDSSIHHVVDFPHLKWNQLLKGIDKCEICNDILTAKLENSNMYLFKIYCINKIVSIVTNLLVFVNVSKKFDDLVFLIFRILQINKLNINKSLPIDNNLKIIYAEEFVFNKFINVNYKYKFSEIDLINEINDSIEECLNPN